MYDKYLTGSFIPGRVLDITFLLVFKIFGAYFAFGSNRGDAAVCGAPFFTISTPLTLATVHKIKRRNLILGAPTEKKTQTWKISFARNNTFL